MSQVGNRIRTVRNTQGLTQAQFSRSLRISQSHLSGIEKGHYQPSGPVLLLISILFGVKEDWLINGEKPIK